MVSEVDRKLYSNILSNEDLEASMDLSEILGMDTALSPEDLVRDFPDDFPTLNLEEDAFSTFTGVTFHDDLQQDFSDSSDSGISGVITQYENQPSPDVLIKQEPLSPASSLASDGSDLTVSQSHKTYTTIDHDLKIESPPLSPQTSIIFPGQNIHQQTFGFINDQPENGKQVIIGPPPKTCNTVLPGFDTTVNINSILNSKIKIQPKPAVTESTVQKPTLPKTDAGKPLVLTPEEFKRLTAQGVLKFQPPPREQKSKVEIPKVSTTVISPPQVNIVASPILQVDSEMKNMKRQQRMIKNRESASLSRKRKKEYLQTLEEQLHEYTQQNQKLMQENENLRRRLSLIQTENEELKKSGIMASPAKKICLMAIFVLFTLNLGSFSDLLLSSRTIHNSNLSPGDRVGHKGRQLLTINEEKDTYSVGSFMPDYPYSMLKKFVEENPDHAREINNKTLYQLYTCPTYFNKTESIRLADQLSGWMKRHEQQKKKKQRKPVSKEPRPLTPSHSLRGELRHLREQRYRAQEAKYQLQLFQGDTMTDFWQSLPRRNDTFYVLSFNTDYFLIPAVAHNKTMRPRMSLVMPATTLNETMQPPAGNIGMMQIDCEVLNTQLIHVHKSSLPRQHSSNTTNDESFFP